MPITVGTVTVDRMRGRPVPRASRVRVLRRDGYDGHDLKLIGQRAAQTVIETDTTVTYTAAALKTAIDDRLALAGSVVTITDDLGQAHANCSIIDVQPTHRPILVGATEQFLVQTRWTVIKGPEAV
jgi:hypothetical protein